MIMPGESMGAISFKPHPARKQTEETSPEVSANVHSYTFSNRKGQNPLPRLSTASPVHPIIQIQLCILQLVHKSHGKGIDLAKPSSSVRVLARVQASQPSRE